VAGINALLSTAARERSVKEFVFTSSIVAATWPVAGLTTHAGRNTWNEAAVEAAWAPPPYEAARGMGTYAASKVASEKEVWRFVDEEKPGYNVNVVCPSGVIGQPFHVKHVDGPGKWVATLYRGQKEILDPFPAGEYTAIPMPTFDSSVLAFFVDVKDIALLHVAAVLDPDTKNARLHAWAHNSNWNEFLAVLRELRPQKQFIADYTDPHYLTISADEDASVALLKKWSGQEGWLPLRQALIDSVENEYFRTKVEGIS
jgi:nucleoside-diphosphate-sugar epimerase